MDGGADEGGGHGGGGAAAAAQDGGATNGEARLGGPLAPSPAEVAAAGGSAVEMAEALSQRGTLFSGGTHQANQLYNVQADIHTLLDAHFQGVRSRTRTVLDEQREKLCRSINTDLKDALRTHQVALQAMDAFKRNLMGGKLMAGRGGRGRGGGRGAPPPWSKAKTGPRARQREGLRGRRGQLCTRQGEAEAAAGAPAASDAAPPPSAAEGALLARAEGRGVSRRTSRWCSRSWAARATRWRTTRPPPLGPRQRRRWPWRPPTSDVRTTAARVVDLLYVDAHRIATKNYG